MSKKVLIVGSGIIGNLWATLLHYKGVRNVVVSEASELRREITHKLGKFGYYMRCNIDLEKYFSPNYISDRVEIFIISKHFRIWIQDHFSK